MTVRKAVRNVLLALAIVVVVIAVLAALTLRVLWRNWAGLFNPDQGAGNHHWAQGQSCPPAPRSGLGRWPR